MEYWNISQGRTKAQVIVSDPEVPNSRQTRHLRYWRVGDTAVLNAGMYAGMDPPMPQEKQIQVSGWYDTYGNMYKL